MAVVLTCLALINFVLLPVMPTPTSRTCSPSVDIGVHLSEKAKALRGNASARIAVVFLCCAARVLCCLDYLYRGRPSELVAVEFRTDDIVTSIRLYHASIQL